LVIANDTITYSRETISFAGHAVLIINYMERIGQIEETGFQISESNADKVFDIHIFSFN
jgi:hypothetical protein